MQFKKQTKKIKKIRIEVCPIYSELNHQMWGLNHQYIASVTEFPEEFKPKFFENNCPYRV